MSYAELLYTYEILDHAHSILGSITPIQVIQPVARKHVTAEAVPSFTLPNLIAGLDSAYDAGLWFVAVVAAATGTCVLISRMGNTETTVHPTGCDQPRLDHLCLC